MSSSRSLHAFAFPFPFPAGLPRVAFFVGSRPSLAFISFNFSRITVSRPSLRRESSITSSVCIARRPACFAKDSRSRDVVARFALVIVQRVSTTVYEKHHTDLVMHKLCQRGNEVRCSIQIAVQALLIHVFANSVPQGGFKFLDF